MFVTIAFYFLGGNVRLYRERWLGDIGAKTALDSLHPVFLKTWPFLLVRGAR